VHLLLAATLNVLVLYLLGLTVQNDEIVLAAVVPFHSQASIRRKLDLNLPLSPEVPSMDRIL
jgi:hypothetical protein